MLKIFTTLLLITSTVATALAQFTGDGYYRIQNYKTGRYAYLIDDKGEVNVTTTSIDLYAIRLWKGFEKVCSDPSAVLYISNHGGAQHNLTGQGTNLYSIIGQYLKLYKNSDGTYLAYGENSGMARYLGDGIENTAIEGSWLIDNGQGDIRKWYIKPISTNGDEYFGVLPQITIGNKNYASFYAGFPFSFASNGMRAYYISRVENFDNKGFAILNEVEAEVIPAGTPLFIECSSIRPVDNKLNIGGNATASITNNLLKGVYFENTMKGHINFVANDKATMRVLDKTSDGKLGFVTSDVKNMPANKAYLQVPEGTPAELEVMTDEEFETYKKNHDGVELVVSDNNKCFDVYNILGVKVRSNVTTLEGLPAGIYIANGKKYIKK